MRQFTGQQNTVTVNRQSYTAGKSSFSTVGTYSGYLRPLSPEVASANGFQFGYAFAVIFEYGVDVRVGDKLVIGSTTYTVKGIASYGTGRTGTDFVKAIVTLPEV